MPKYSLLVIYIAPERANPVCVLKVKEKTCLKKFSWQPAQPNACLGSQQLLF